MPVLFVHGHRGSFLQARDLSAQLDAQARSVDNRRRAQVAALAAAAAATKQSSSDLLDPTVPRPARVVLYAIDFGSGPGNNAAFEAWLLQQQAAFVNDALEHLQRLHNGSRIQAVGLSVGGVVLRLAALRPDHPLWPAAPTSSLTPMTSSESPPAHSCLSVIYTLNTPHRAHPAFVEPAMSSLYAQMNRAWAGHFAVADAPSSLLSQLSLVSFNGGTRDRQVRSDLGTLDGIAPPSHSLHVYSSALHGVQMEIDHDAVAWCAQFVSQLAHAIEAVASADIAWAKRPEPQRHHMPLLRSLLESKTPTQLQLHASEPWRLSTSAEGEVTPTIAVSSADQHHLAISSSTPLPLSSPVDRNFSSLHRPIRVQLSESGTCASTFLQHHMVEHKAETSDIYSLDIEGGPSASPSVHLIPLPSAAFEHLVLLTNIPSQYVCGSLWTEGKDAPALRVRPWLVDLPPNTRTTRLTSRLTPDGQHVNTVEHVWQGGTAQRPITLLTLRRDDIPSTVRHVELMFLLPEESKGAKLWARVQFTPPTATSTHVRRWWGGVEASVGQSMLLALPVSDTTAPNPSLITFTSIKPIDALHASRGASERGGAWPSFGPLLYTVSLPSGESFWQMHLPRKAMLFRVPSFHLSTQAQSTHTIMFLDPAFEYRLHVSTDILALLGQQLLAWHGIVVASVFAFLALGLLLQVRSYALAADEGHRLHDRRVSHIYALLARHWPHSVGLALLLSVVASLVRTMLGVRNVGMEASVLLSFVYSMAGWGVVVVLDCAVAVLVHIFADELATMRRKCTPPPSSAAPSKHYPALQWLSLMFQAVVLVIVPLHLLLVSLFIYMFVHVWKESTLMISAPSDADADSDSDSVSAQRRLSSQYLSQSLVLVLTLATSLRLPSIYQQAEWGWLHRSFDQLEPSDSVYTLVCVLLLAELSRIDRISFDGLQPQQQLPAVPSAPLDAHRAAPSNTLVLHATLLYRMLGLLALFAFYFTRVHFHQSLLLVAVIAASLLFCPAVDWCEWLRARVFGPHSGASLHRHPSDGSPSADSASSFAVDASPSLGVLDRVASSRPVRDDIELQSLLDDGGSVEDEEAQLRHVRPQHGRGVHDSALG